VNTSSSDSNTVAFMLHKKVTFSRFKIGGIYEQETIMSCLLGVAINTKHNQRNQDVSQI